MTGLFLFGFVFEKTALETKIHPEKYGLTDYVEKGLNFLLLFCDAVISAALIC